MFYLSLLLLCLCLFLLSKHLLNRQNLVDPNSFNRLIEVTCEGGWKFHGTLKNSILSPFGSLLWIKIIHKDTLKPIVINAKYIVTIKYM